MLEFGGGAADGEWGGVGHGGEFSTGGRQPCLQLALAPKLGYRPGMTETKEVTITAKVGPDGRVEEIRILPADVELDAAAWNTFAVTFSQMFWEAFVFHRDHHAVEVVWP